MTLQDRTEQNKKCWKRITELEASIVESRIEINDLHKLIVENMVKIADIKQNEPST